MEHIIARLLQDFEHGMMSRRQLIQSLAAIAGSVAIAPPPAAVAAFAAWCRRGPPLARVTDVEVGDASPDPALAQEREERVDVIA